MSPLIWHSCARAMGVYIYRSFLFSGTEFPGTLFFFFARAVGGARAWCIYGCGKFLKSFKSMWNDEIARLFPSGMYTQRSS